MPFQSLPQGSPPPELQPVNLEGELKLLYITFKAETATDIYNHYCKRKKEENKP